VANREERVGEYLDEQGSGAVAAPTRLSLLERGLLGLMAATAPCQLSTNAASIAYFSTDAVQGRGWGRVLLFLIGKTLVYLTLAGIAVWVFGGDFGAPGAVFVGVRLIR
jgi:cytochrome c-type biogenesis protein